MYVKAESQNALDCNRVLELVENAIEPVYLNKVQEIVLKDTFEGKTYSQIASTYCYDREYIKTVGCELWQLLSKSFDRQITKANFSQFIRHYANSIRFTKLLSHLEVDQNTINSNKRQDWGTAPSVSICLGRNKELKKLNEWIEDERCRLVIVSGALGIGKTNLVVKFAERVKKKFDYVIWRSLWNAPSIDELLDNLLCLFDRQPIQDSFDTLDNKILQLLFYLNQHRCLLVLDDLQAILDSGDRFGHYINSYENYAHMLHSLMSARHQSSIILVGQQKPKEFSIYKQEQFRHLVLDPQPKSSLRHMFKKQLSTELSEEKWYLFCEKYVCNPKLLEIAISVIDKYFNGNIEQFLQQKSTLVAEIREVLDQQFERLPSLTKQIAYSIAIENAAVTLDELQCDFIANSSTITILESIENLEQIAFINQQNNSYYLYPLAKDYLKRKLFETVCQQIN